jgi:acyl phosphate:glycerol-3-phosphate acyltransferase
MIRAAAYLVLAFLAGSLPFGLWIGRWARGVDVRAHGSGNIGATNVLRVAGVGWGLLALALDVAKGWLAVALLPRALGLGSVGEGSWAPVAGALAATCGHIFSPLVGWRGGKGVATFLGAAFALAPAAAAIALAGFFLTLAISRFVSAGSIVMALLFPLAALRFAPAGVRPPVAVAGAAIAALIVWRHRANLARLARGEEPKLGRRR